MCIHRFLRGKKKIEIEIEIGRSSVSITVWRKFEAETIAEICALFDSCKNPSCAYFQNRIASIELAFGY